MPAPTSYSEAQLAALMVDEMGAVATSLGLTATSAGILRAITAVERLLEVSDVATATDMAVVEAAARWQAWAVAEASMLASPNKIKSDGDELDYGQRLQGIRDRLAYAQSDWYAVKTASDTANGTSTVFAFATIPGCRGL